MSTVSKTIFVDFLRKDSGRELFTLYGYYDGAPAVWGKTLKDFFNGKKISNEFSLLNNSQGSMGQLAFEFINSIKTDISNGFMIDPPNINYIVPDYLYYVTHKGEKIYLVVMKCYDKDEHNIYSGPISDFNV